MSVRKREIPVVHVRRKGVLTRVFIGVFILCLIYVASTILARQGEQMERVLARQAEISKELDKAEAAFLETREMYDSMGTDAFIEKIAREKLGMLRPGEILFED